MQGANAQGKGKAQQPCNHHKEHNSLDEGSGEVGGVSFYFLHFPEAMALD